MQEQTNITQEKIFELYGDYLLNQGEKPKTFISSLKKTTLKRKNFTIIFLGLMRSKERC